METNCCGPRPPAPPAGLGGCSVVAGGQVAAEAGRGAQRERRAGEARGGEGRQTDDDGSTQ